MLVQHPWKPTIPDEIAALFSAEGMALLGVCNADADPDALSEYTRWLSLGYAGTMDYLHRHRDAKYHPEQILAGTRSILLAGLNYYRRLPGDSSAEATTRVARYAWGRDYHRVLAKRLKRIVGALREQYPDEQFRAFTDATPLSERHYAARAGIGFTGRHTLTISGQYGSWFLIAEVLSTRHYPQSVVPPHAHGSCPRTCRRCIDICPTGALLGPHQIDASRCISYLTIEHRGAIPVELRPSLGGWLFGCDLCQETCPLNIRAHETTEPDFLTDRAGPHPSLAEILSIETDEEFRARFAGSPLARAGRVGLQRNACVVAANTRRFDLQSLLKRRAEGAEPIVAAHARWALDQLANGSPLTDSR
ncbi:MAG: tRNA epoxyqueuosine(34) reductase QueG [Spirochaetaceae bacterium]|nr:MAG: tRNA epoxyqueuosine(34) reductase QueG [Spirochaetaceae bacterium]